MAVPDSAPIRVTKLQLARVVVAGLARALVLRSLLLTCFLVNALEEILSRAMSGLNLASADLARDKSPTPPLAATDMDEAEFDQFKWLGQYTPCFEVDSANIQVIHTPAEFYENLQSMLGKAEKRIVMSSLYLGTGSLEKDLANAIKSSLTKSEDLKVKVLLDHSRGLRGEENSKTTLESLTKDFPSQMNFYLYHTPQLRGYRKRFIPQRANETIGVLHMKIYIADDTLIISGANLSNDYFVNRQDRYIKIKNCPKLCDFFEALVDCVAKYSFRVNNVSGHVEYSNENQSEHPFLGSLSSFATGLNQSLTSLLKTFRAEPDRCRDTALAVPETNKAFIYPLIQCSDCQFKLDELVTNEIFKKAPKQSSLYLAVGYFNLTNEYIDSIVAKSEASYEFLVSSPEANGFYGSKGFTQYVPSIYSNIEEQFFNLINATNNASRIRIKEYERDNWTYHAKGLWYYPRSNNRDNLPSMTIVGSSNFGYRSVNRDFEAQLLIHSANKQLQASLNMEKINLFDKCKTVTADVFLVPNRVSPAWLKYLTRFMKSFF